MSGVMVGKSGEMAGHPDGEAFYPNDVGATIYHALGIPPHSQLLDYEDRPFEINDGTPITRLF